MSAFALAATSRSPLTCTGTFSARTPLQDGGDRIVALGELQAEHLLDALPITSSSSRPVKAKEFFPHPTTRPSPSQTKNAASGAVVVVEQFEQECEPALGATLGWRVKPMLRSSSLVR